MRDIRGHRRGLTLIEAALVLGVLALVMGGLTQLMSEAAETSRSKTVADQFVTVLQASQQYIKTNQTSLIAMLPAVGNSTVVPIGRTTPGGGVPPGPGALTSVQGGGFLPNAFVDADAYGQHHSLVVQNVLSAGGVPHIEAMLVSQGGLAIPDRQIGRVARFAGGQAGYMMTNPLPGTVAQITGVGGSWQVPAASWSSGGVVPSTGHTMAALTVNDVFASDYLVRDNVGIPALNTMNTDIHMAANSINGLTSLTNGAVDLVQTDPSALTIGPNISIPGYLNAQGDIMSGGSVVANKNVVAATGYVYAGAFAAAPTYYDSTNYGYYMQPANSTVLNHLTTNVLSMDTLVTGASYTHNGHALGVADNVRLGDLLPHYVAMGGYVVTSGGVVPKPACGLGTGTPKIILSPMQDSYEFTQPIGYGYIPAGNYSGIEYTWAASAAVYSIEDTVTSVQLSDFSKVARSVYAVNVGASWQVVFSGTWNVPGYTSAAVAQVFCEY